MNLGIKRYSYVNNVKFPELTHRFNAIQIIFSTGVCIQVCVHIYTQAQALNSSFCDLLIDEKDRGACSIPKRNDKGLLYETGKLTMKLY